MASVLVSPAVIVQHVDVAADCEISSVAPEAPPELHQYFRPLRTVIVSVGGVEVSDRSHLRELLGSLPSEAPVEFILRDYLTNNVSIDLSNSVQYDGAPATMAPQAEPESEEEEPEGDPNQFPETETAVNHSPQKGGEVSLLAFDTLDMNAAQKQPLTVREKISHAVGKVDKGRCIIAVTTAVSPLAEIENLAREVGKNIVLLNCGMKLRHRPTNEALGSLFADALRNGHWFLIIHGHKSIQSLRTIEAMLKELHDHNMAGIHDESRIIICTESHPHFPKYLTDASVSLKIAQSFSQSKFMLESMASSMSFMKLMQGTSVRATSEALHTPKRKVRISPAVDIVDIAPRDICRKTKANLKPIDVSGSVVQTHTFAGLPNDKFLSVGYAGTPGRYAVGSSLGNVYFLDDQGNGIAEIHAHDASVWDTSFTNPFCFASGSEDGTCITWESCTDDGIALQKKNTAALGADIYCVHHQHRGVADSPLLIGGLAHKLLVVRGDQSQFIESKSSVQAVTSLYNSNHALIGAGDGSLRVVDVNVGQELLCYTEHQRKVPTLAVNESNLAFTGSFDCSIRSWDARVDNKIACTHTLKLKNYITGIDVDDNHLVASVGDNIYIWDIRKLNEVLGGYPQGWKGLSRGIKINAAAHQIVTASPDGFVRFWQYS